jgi:molybdate transport system ATP-binding protein
MVPTPESTGLGIALDGAVRRGGFRLQAAFEVRAGEVVGVIGPNGAGKTTLLRALAGLDPLSAGRLSLAGQVLDEPGAGVFVPPERRPVGVVFQNYRLFPAMSVLDNVGFGPRSRGAGRRESRAVARQWLQRLHIGDLDFRKPRELSGGQAQRVALARALAASPEMLLLDEPLAALDARTKLDVRAELRAALREFSGVTVLVTHDPLEAMVMTDRLVVVEDGRVVQSVPPAEFARRPATGYVARLVGLNFYRGRWAGERAVRLADGSTLTAAARPEPAHPAAEVLVALRPNAIAVHTSRPTSSSPRNLWPGTVTALELHTDRVRAFVDGPPAAMVDLTPEAVADLHLVEGAPVWLSAKATDVDVYPAG